MPIIIRKSTLIDKTHNYKRIDSQSIYRPILLIFVQIDLRVIKTSAIKKWLRKFWAIV